MYKIILLLSILLFINNCSNKAIYSGKYLNQEDLDNINFKNKENLIEKMGTPSFIDPIEKKYFYYTEKEYRKSAFNKNIEFSYVFVFQFDDLDIITKSEVYDLKNKKNIELINDETENEIIRRGLIEKIFGGVGPQQEFATSP